MVIGFVCTCAPGLSTSLLYCFAVLQPPSVLAYFSLTIHLLHVCVLSMNAVTARRLHGSSPAGHGSHYVIPFPSYWYLFCTNTVSHAPQDPEGILAAPKGGHIQRRSLAKQIAQDKELAEKVEQVKQQARQELLAAREVRKYLCRLVSVLPVTHRYDAETVPSTLSALTCIVKPPADSVASGSSA